jgi:ribonucleotide monophosphatase NagD (HAD superfamily)
MPLPERISGFLIDLDGTIVEGGELIPGALEALNALIQRGIPFRIVTNTTSKPRSAILAKMHTLGIDLAREQLITAPIIGRDYLQREGITRCFALLKTSLLEELTYGALNRAFRFLLDGAAFITLARNRYFRGVDGLCLDVGAFVTALEYATQKQAILIGKPASEFFTLACQNMGVPLAGTVVVGDDLEADVGGAKFAGCVGVLVRTGKFRPDQIETSEIRPDAILDSLADLPSLMG